MSNGQEQSALQETEKRLARVKEIFANADRLDLEKYVSSFAEDASFQVGNNPPAVGREEIRKAGGKMFSALKAMRHDIVQIWLEEDAAIIEARVNYTRHDNQIIIVPCVTILRTDGELVKDGRVFMDATPVFG